MFIALFRKMSFKQPIAYYVKMILIYNKRINKKIMKIINALTKKDLYNRLKKTDKVKRKKYNIIY